MCGRPAREVALDGPETVLAPMRLASFDVKRRHAPQAKREQGSAVLLGDCAPRGVVERRMNLSGGNTGALSHLQQTLILSHIDALGKDAAKERRDEIRAAAVRGAIRLRGKSGELLPRLLERLSTGG